MENFFLSKKTLFITLPLFILLSFFSLSSQVSAQLQYCSGQVNPDIQAPIVTSLGVTQPCAAGSCGNMWCKTGEQICSTLSYVCNQTGWSAVTFCAYNPVGGILPVSGGCDTSTCTAPVGDPPSCPATGGGGGGITPPPSTTANFTVSVLPSTHSALNGETKRYYVEATPNNSAAAGTYTFIYPIPGCPVGATCEYLGRNNKASTGTDTRTNGDEFATPAVREVFVTPTSTPAGTYTLTFSATKDGTSITRDTSAFLIVNPGVNNASCTSISAPNSVVAGATFSGTIVMKNIGSKIWDSIYTSPTDMAHSLGSSNPIDNLRWGPSSGRTALPGGTPIAPGQPVTFTKNFTAPSTTGTYSFNFRMVEDAVQWFGEECVKSITVTAPTPVPVVTISVSPTSGVVGFNATITWSATNNPTACTATGDWVATPALATASNQTQSQGILSTSGQRQYILTCSNASGSGLSANAVVNVNPVVVNSYRLFITKSGQGTVTSSPAGINCGITCQADFAEGTNIIITAIPNAGRIFTGWGGACVGVLRKPSGPSTCTRTMQSNNINVIANFAVDPSYKEF